MEPLSPHASIGSGAGKQSDALAATNRDDGALLAAARAGDRIAFGRLIGRHRQGLKLYCYAMVGDPTAAHHAMAETVVTAWLELNVADPNTKARTWLYRIAIRVCSEATGDVPVRRPP
jgi:Sigma-70 region 2